MHRLESFYKTLTTILIVIFLSIEAYLVHLVSEIKIENKFYPFIIIGFIIGLILIFKFVEFLVEKLLEESKIVRALILRDDFIEGVWLDKVDIDGISGYGLITIVYQNGKFIQTGEQILYDGTTRCSWNSVASEYDNNTLKIIYHVKYFDEKLVDQPYGISMYRFAKSGSHKQPLSYIGTFFDMSNNYMTKSVKGFKVTDKKLIAKLYVPETRNEALKILMNSNFFKKIE